jgi:hypothetical protein
MVCCGYRLVKEQVREEVDKVQQKIGGDCAHRTTDRRDCTDTQKPDICCEIALVLAHDSRCLAAEDLNPPGANLHPTVI